ETSVAREVMGIYVDYVLRAECAEEELRSRLERLRQRCLDLPLKAVGDVQRIEPVYNPIVFMLLEKEGHALPAAISERLRKADENRDHGTLCITFAPMLDPKLPKRELDRYYAPADALMKQTDLWNAEDLPEKVAQTKRFGISPFTVYRKGIEFEFANVMLRYGYVLILHPGDGCESVNLALSTYKQPEGR